MPEYNTENDIRELQVTDMRQFGQNNIVIDLYDQLTGDNDATVSVHLKEAIMEVRVSGFLVATFPMGSREELDP